MSQITGKDIKTVGKARFAGFTYSLALDDTVQEELWGGHLVEVSSDLGTKVL